MKTRKHQIFLALVLLLSLLLSLLPASVFADGITPPAENIEVRLYIDRDSADYPTGSEPSVYAGVKLTGNNVQLDGAYMITTVPNQYLDLSYNLNKVLKASGGATLIRDPIITSDAHNSYVRYDYLSMSGGTAVELPFFFKIKSFTTPPDSQILIKTELFAANGSSLGSKQLTITNKASCTLATTYSSHYFKETRYRPGNPTHTSSNPDELDVFSLNLVYQNKEYSYGAVLGIYEPSKVKLTVTLAEGVVYDAACAAVDSTWTYDSAARTLTKTIVHYSSVNPFTIAVPVKLPNVQYGASFTAMSTQVVALDAAGNVIPETASNISKGLATILAKPAPTYIYYVNQSKASPTNLNYNDSYRDQTSLWSIKTINDSYWSNVAPETPADAILPKSAFVGDIVDSDLNSHLYYYSIKIDANGSLLANKTELNTNILYGSYYVNNVQYDVEIARNIPVNEDYVLPADNHLDKTRVYRKLTLVFPNKVELKHSQYINISVGTKVFESDWATAASDTHDWFLGGNSEMLNTALSNKASASVYTERPQTIASFTPSSSNYYYIRSGGVARVQSSANNSNCMQGDISTTTFKLLGSGLAVEHDGKQTDLVNGKLVVVLPNGWGYSNTGATKTKIQYQTKAGQTVTVDAVDHLTYDYMGTGKRALIIDLPDRMIGTYMSIMVNLKALSSTPKGDSTVDGYLSYTNNGDYEYLAIGSIKYTDQWDINQNGKTTDILPMTAQTITYTPPREVVGIKRVGKTTASMTPTGTSSIDLGGRFYYGFDVLNLQKSDIVKTLSIIDILPYVGDKSIVPDLSGVYADRGSQYRVHITGPVMLMKDGAEVNPADNGYDVLYSTDTPVDGNLAQNLQKSFSKSVDDWSAVTMIKINMQSGTTIEAETTVAFVVPAMVPNDTENIKDNDIAFNSFALAANNNVNAPLDAASFIEAIMVATPVASYQVSGTVYRDFNLDSAFSVNEKGLSGISMGLYDESGALVSQTATDANGQYTFNVAARGSYTVKILEKPAGMEFPDAANHFDDIFPAFSTSSDKQLVGGLQVGNDIDNAGSSASFTIDPSKRHVTVNAALEDELISIPAAKHWFGADPPVDTILVELIANDQGKELSLTRAGDWRGEFVHLRSLDENGRRIAYALIERSEFVDFTAVISGDVEAGFLIRNISREARSISIEKTWVGAEKEILVNLLADGKVIDSFTMNSSTGWKRTISDLPRFDNTTGNEITYTVSESLAGYTTSISGDMVSGFVIKNIRQAQVQTGDITGSGLWLALMAASGAGMLITAFTFKKRRKNQTEI